MINIHPLPSPGPYLAFSMGVIKSLGHGRSQYHQVRHDSVMSGERLEELRLIKVSL